MVGVTSFSLPYMCILPPLQSPPKILSSTSFNFHLPIPPLLLNKIIPTIPTNIPFLCTSTLFLPPYFCVQTSQQSTPKIFSLPQPFSQFRLRQGTKDLWSLVRNDTVLISPFFLKVWTLITGTTITDTLNLLSLLPYPTNTITRTHIAYLFKLIFILSLAFSYSIHAPLHPYV